MKFARTFLTAASVAALVAGCTSNTGGTVAFAPESFPEIPAGASMTVNGTARVMPLTLQTESTNRFIVDEGTKTVPTDATFTVGLDSERNVSSMRIVAADRGLDQTLDETNATVSAATVPTTHSTPADISQVTGALTDGGFAIEVVTGQDGVDFNYQVFGAWIQETSATTQDTGAFTAGFETAATGVPTSGKMYYEGEAQGFFVTPSYGFRLATLAKFNMTVDFGESQSFVFSTNSSRVNSGSGYKTATNYDNFTGSGLLSGSTMTGTIQKPGGGYTGTINAQLYGPAADEIGGTFAAANGAGQHYFGSFGGAAVAP